MILLVEPISKNIGMYVPAFPLPVMEIASYVKQQLPKVDISVISLPIDFGLPLTPAGKEALYREFLNEISTTKPKGIGISCTAIAQAEEVIHLCELIKDYDPGIFIFLGGYFPTIYPEDIFSRTSAVDLIVTGEGEIPTCKIVEALEKDQNPLNSEISNLTWKKNGKIYSTPKGPRFDLGQKALLDLNLLKYPRAYDILPYAFSRGCSYKCRFCMEDLIRPHRKEVPAEIVKRDLLNLSRQSSARTLLVSDALFKSFDLFPLFHSLGMKVNFETRCDVFDPAIIPQIADACGALALGFESASYATLKSMNKVRDKAHYETYISNTLAIFKEAVKNGISIMVFMIAGYPGDTEKDLEQSLRFAKELAQNKGPGGYVFKIGECRAYPRTKTHQLALALEDVVFDDDGVFGDNVVRQPSQNLNFETVLAYMKEIFDLSHNTLQIYDVLLKIMPFFRLPVAALQDEIIPDNCFRYEDRAIFDVQGESLSTFRELAPRLGEKYRNGMSGQRSMRNLTL